MSNSEKVLNNWKISKKCHAIYYGQVIAVECPGGQTVIRGKPSWIKVTEDQWYRTSPIVKWNRNSSDELVSVETASKHVYKMGTKYLKSSKPAQGEVANVPAEATTSLVKDHPGTVNDTQKVDSPPLDTNLSEMDEKEETMEFIINPDTDTIKTDQSTTKQDATTDE